MAYIPIPKDLSAVKTKVFFNLTKRQIICFGSGALISVPLFFMLNGVIGTSTAALVMIFVMLPFFLLAMYERNGQPLEKVLKQYINARFIRSKVRPYRTDNLYSAIMKQNMLEKEVERIAGRKEKEKTSHTGR